MLAVAQEPERVGTVIAFLCTEAAADINGQTFFVQGNSVGLFAPLEVTQTLEGDAPWTPETLAEAVPELRLHPLDALY